MPIRRSSSRNLLSLPGLTEKDSQRAARALAERHKAREAEHERLDKQLQRIAENTERQRHDLLGAKRARDLRQFIQAEQRSLVAKLQPPAGLQLDRDKAIAQRRRRIDAFVKSQGIEAAKLRKIGLAATEKIEALLATQLEKHRAGFHLHDNLAKWKRLSPFNALGLPFDIEPMEGWELVRPPFFGFLFRSYQTTFRDFVISSDHELDPPAGLVGNSITLSVPGLDEYDMGCGWIETMIAFAFRPAEAGLVEVLVEGQNALGIHDLRTDQTFGFSDSFSQQQNTLFMEVLNPNLPNGVNAEMSYFEKRSDDDDHWNFSNLSRGQSYFAQLVSSAPVAANQHTIILVGTRTFFSATVDDVKVSGTPHFRWFIRSVQVRIAPGTPPPPIT
jgi:hypothetical protein